MNIDNFDPASKAKRKLKSSYQHKMFIAQRNNSRNKKYMTKQFTTNKQGNTR
jgi:hypothetical protein